MKDQAIVGKAVFSDLHKLESSMYRWEVVFKKISIGNFHGVMNAIDLGVVQLIDIRMSGTVFQKGLTPVNYVTFAIPAIDSQAFRWHHRYVDKPSILLFPSNRYLNGVSYDGFHVYVLSIHKQYLDQLLKKLGMESAREQFTGDKKMMPIVKPHIYSINSLLQALFLKVQISENPVLSRTSINNVKFSVPALVLKIVQQNMETDSIPIKRERDRTVSSAIDFMLTQDMKTLTVKEISSHTKIKQRTLEYAFKEYFSVGPKNFMMAMRLNDFRHTLIKKGESVSESAFDYGYSHLGQLSRDYKLLFGELPSETLKWAKMQRLQADPQN